MAVTHSTAARNAATDAVTALISTSGKLVFRISPSTVAAPGTAVATLSLSATAFGASATGTATANAITSDTNATGNASAVAFATLQTSAAVIVIQCAVAASASDINMTNGLTVAAGDTVSCSSLTYTALSA
jgi:hypothetical protein